MAVANPVRKGSVVAAETLHSYYHQGGGQHRRVESTSWQLADVEAADREGRWRRLAYWRGGIARADLRTDQTRTIMVIPPESVDLDALRRDPEASGTFRTVDELRAVVVRYKR